jgi:phosphatidate cytidylyltransferase
VAIGLKTGIACLRGAAAIPQVLAGITAWLPDLTVGLIATLTTVACIIAADTGAYFVGKNLGRTKLTDISPKKTVEGALGGLASAIAVAVLFWKLFSWPGNVVAAAGYAVSGFRAGAATESLVIFCA